MMPIADNPNVTAILFAHYPGAGWLPYTIAYNATDYDFAPITANITTTSEQSDLQVSEASPSTIITTLSVAGSTVAQLYLTFPKSAPARTPIRQLRGFDKRALGVGEEAQGYKLLRRDISYWDTEAQQWRIVERVFKVSVGFSSQDLVEFRYVPARI